MTIHFFDGGIERFIEALERPTIAKVLRTIDLLERFGHQLGMPHSRRIDRRLFELRIRGQQEVRLLYTFHKDTIVLLHGFIKKSHRIPVRESATAAQKLRALDRT
jgi:phage-related protein